MIKCRINITKSKICKNIVVYGLDFTDNEQVIYHFADISTNFYKIKRYCDIINKSDIKQEHILDIIEDILE